MIGQSINHYKITAKLGEGGMGVVYRATDTRLGREVALKILPEKFVEDRQRMSRFQREAEVLASLNHPNISTIYGLEEADRVRALVLELVEGPTLAERIAEGPIPVEETLQITLEIAQALEAAHEKGIIHRDLKPANVKITPEGTVKVLDFGLAKALETELSERELAASPTLTLEATQEGIILGTAAYMSPEQARGKVVDKRTDIWTFGLVLFEMLTGKGMYAGRSFTETIAAVIHQDLSLEDLPEDTPWRIRDLMERCLRKNPRMRLQHMGDARIEIHQASNDPRGTNTVELEKPMPLWRHPAALALALVIGLAAAWLLKPAPSLPEPPLRKFKVALPIESFSGNPLEDGPRISPDGTRLAYAGSSGLWIRDLAHLQARQIADSEGAEQPFWSPGSDYLGYVTRNELRKVAAGGGASTTLCRLGPFPLWGAAWQMDGTIVFSVRTAVGISHLEAVSSRGGEPAPFLQPDGARDEVGIWAPRALPDGRGLVMRVNHQDGSYELVVRTEAGPHTLVRVPAGERIAGLAVSATGHVLYVHERMSYSLDGDLWALPVEPGTWTASGEAFLIARHAYHPSVSADGTLAYRSTPGAGRGQLAWVDRTGTVVSTSDRPQVGMASPTLSPDGRFVAVWGREQGKTDIWLHDVERGSRTRLSYDLPDNTPTLRLSWSPDGDRIVFGSRDPTRLSRDLYIQATDGRSPPKPLVETDADEIGADWSPDGETILYDVSKPDGDADLWMLSLSDAENPKVFLQTPFIEGAPCFSPDGHYVAYISKKSGRYEVYVTRFPDAEGQWRVSMDGGVYPQWRGEEIFYVDLEKNALMAAQVRTGPTFHAELPRPLFSGEPINTVLLGPTTLNYTVSLDGQHFVVVQPVEAGEQTTPTIIVVENWIKEFEGQQ